MYIRHGSKPKKNLLAKLKLAIRKNFFSCSNVCNRLQGCSDNANRRGKVLLVVEESTNSSKRISYYCFEKLSARL